MKHKGIIARVLIAIVLFFNLQAALVFITRPAAYMGGLGLEGIAGIQMVRALGLLFLMWNVPYIFTMANPIRNRISLIEAVLMQAIGLIGETMILLLGGSNSEKINSTLIRFIIFDGGGLVLLIAALLITMRGYSSEKAAS